MLFIISSWVFCSGLLRLVVGFFSCCGLSGRVSDRVVFWLLLDWMLNFLFISCISWWVMIRLRWLLSLLVERKLLLCSLVVSSVLCFLVLNGWLLFCMVMCRCGVLFWLLRVIISRILFFLVCLNVLFSRFRIIWCRCVGLLLMICGICGWVKLISLMCCCLVLIWKIFR